MSRLPPLGWVHSPPLVQRDSATREATLLEEHRTREKDWEEARGGLHREVKAVKARQQGEGSVWRGAREVYGGGQWS